ncbi:MAG TPA: MFS transporter [Xanthobacteraceae bacterium]|nr:MFS transporter [Xanthobacteraceae bacterium]
MTAIVERARRKPGEVESAYAWVRLFTGLALGTVGSVGMWSVVVALPAVQAEFAVARAEASLPFTFAMIGFGIGAVILGQLADRFGIVVSLLGGAAALCVGYIAESLAPNLWMFALAAGVAGFGSSATFAPLLADMSHWFVRRRGIAVAIVGCGNYLAGTVWPPVVQHFIAADGWRPTHFGIGLFCAAASPLALVLLRRIETRTEAAEGAAAAGALARLGISSRTLMTLICVAGVGCCTAMSVPQVHIVAYCGDLGYGVARGAEMLSLMLGFGVISRVASGYIADRIGGVATLLVGAMLQGVALFLYLFFNGLVSLYVISALFGLFQGGIVPMYAIIVREYFAPREAGTRVGIAIFATIVGMAFGGWVSGWIFDLTGSYRVAFLNGLAFNLLNVSIMTWLLLRTRAPRLAAA